MKHAFTGSTAVLTCVAVFGWTVSARAQTTVVSPTPATTPVTTTAAPSPTTVTVQQNPVPVGTTTTTYGQVYVTNPPAQAETTTHWSPNAGLLTGGAVLFVGPYVAGDFVAAYSTHAGDNKLYIPVAGPWMDLSSRQCDTLGCGAGEDGYKALLIISGISQGLGVLAMVGSFLFPEVRTVTTVPATAYTPEMRITPINLGRDGYGLGAVASF